MKFVHIADMHFDIPFTTLNKKELGNSRRLDQRKAFKEIIEYIKQNNIEYLFIAGDLYEHEYVKQSTIEYINNLFKEIPNTNIYITPGNHDPILKDSYYTSFNWNNNVHIFNSNIEKIEKNNICIYGYGFDNFYMSDNKLNQIQEELNYLCSTPFFHLLVFSEKMDKVDGIDIIACKESITEEAIYTVGNDFFDKNMLLRYNGYRMINSNPLLYRNGIRKTVSVKSLVRRL